MPNIAIVWDFDGTLTPDDSTTKTVEVLQGSGKGGEFWSMIKALRGDQELPQWEHILAMDAPIWMYSLSRLAATKKVPLNAEFFKEFVLPQIALYPKVLDFLIDIKNLEQTEKFRRLNLEIHHFVVSAGLKELIEQVFPAGLVTWTFGCRYTVVVDENHSDEPESVPVFCMDETVKTRSLFEISKGAFNNQSVKVNTRVPAVELWSPFENIIYIGDGDTDVPALSLTRSKGGLGIAVFNPEKSAIDTRQKFKNMRLDKRTDLITPADFSIGGELHSYIYNRCVQIRQRYEASEVLQ
ncbi:MAG: haloacid dehalogenase-like hydrolase [Micavibrio aeruginosavorus]|uniref:Haloacid dehalogenase-like hydrolase n=1 Tax=Micavibrio aeruginosavorus TaxID=349221 RepID=A0A7T5R0I8_9BACT|nr:MAG: haloacid dehalogenase-like hydrolase [Micavibrio aeruginosavorus]